MKKWEWNAVKKRKRNWKKYGHKCSKKKFGQPHRGHGICFEAGTSIRPTVRQRLWWRDKGRLEAWSSLV